MHADGVAGRKVAVAKRKRATFARGRPTNGKLVTLLARLKGFEPLTYGLEVRCSIQLSYRRINEENAYHSDR